MPGRSQGRWFGGSDIPWWYPKICMYMWIQIIWLSGMALSLSRILPSLGFPTKGAEASNRLPRSWLPCVWCCFGPATFKRAVRLVGMGQGVETSSNHIWYIYIYIHILYIYIWYIYIYIYITYIYIYIYIIYIYIYITCIYIIYIYVYISYIFYMHVMFSLFSPYTSYPNAAGRRTHVNSRRRSMYILKNHDVRKG